MSTPVMVFEIAKSAWLTCRAQPPFCIRFGTLLNDAQNCGRSFVSPAGGEFAAGNWSAIAGFCGPGSVRLAGFVALIAPCGGSSGLPNEAARAVESTDAAASPPAPAPSRRRLDTSTMMISTETVIAKGTRAVSIRRSHPKICRTVCASLLRARIRSSSAPRFPPRKRVNPGKLSFIRNGRLRRCQTRRYRFTATAVIQAQTSNTAAVNRTVATVLPPVDAIIANPVRKTTPVTTENAAQPEQLCADAAGGMGFLVIEQLPGTDKARGCDHNKGNSDKDQGEPVVTAKRPRQPFELQSTSRIKRVGICHREHKQIELLDDEPECYHGDASAHPSEKRSLISSMITIAADH